MSEKRDYYYNLMERIDDAFSLIDNDICLDLRKNNSEYAKLRDEIIKLQEDFREDFRNIRHITDGNGALCLSADEHEALIRYLDLKHDMDNMERKQIYFRGHTDGFAYLRRIGAI